MRNELAVMDYNHHFNRAQKLNKYGEPLYFAKFSKATKEWTAYNVLSKKAYSYIPGKYYDNIILYTVSICPKRDIESHLTVTAITCVSSTSCFVSRTKL